MSGLRPRFPPRMMVSARRRGAQVTKSKCIGIGLALGLIVGVATHSYGLGILIGLAIGGGIWLVQQRRQGGG
jgi:hypothetical protein